VVALFPLDWGVDKYVVGSGYGDIAMEVDDAYAACEAAAAAAAVGRQGAAPGRVDVARQHRHRLHRGPRRLPDRVHREGGGGVGAVGLGVTKCVTC